MSFMVCCIVTRVAQQMMVTRVMRGRRRVMKGRRRATRRLSQAWS
jgi:hypothetical protein